MAMSVATSQRIARRRKAERDSRRSNVLLAVADCGLLVDRVGYGKVVGHIPTGDGWAACGKSLADLRWPARTPSRSPRTCPDCAASVTDRSVLTRLQMAVDEVLGGGVA